MFPAKGWGFFEKNVLLVKKKKKKMEKDHYFKAKAKVHGLPE